MTKEQYLAGIYENEDQFQAATYAYINNNHPALRKLIFHVPNGGLRDKREAMKFKSMGILTGCPDLVCIKPVFGLELKIGTNTQSEAQKTVETVWKAAGAPYFVCRTPIEVINALNILL